MGIMKKIIETPGIRELALVGAVLAAATLGSGCRVQVNHLNVRGMNRIGATGFTVSNPPAVDYDGGRNPYNSHVQGRVDATRGDADYDGSGHSGYKASGSVKVRF